jgi:hypothetical protein
LALALAWKATYHLSLSARLLSLLSARLLSLLISPPPCPHIHISSALSFNFPSWVPPRFFARYWPTYATDAAQPARIQLRRRRSKDGRILTFSFVRSNEGWYCSIAKQQHEPQDAGRVGFRVDLQHKRVWKFCEWGACKGKRGKIVHEHCSPSSSSADDDDSGADANTSESESENKCAIGDDLPAVSSVAAQPVSSPPARKPHPNAALSSASAALSLGEQAPGPGINSASHAGPFTRHSPAPPPFPSSGAAISPSTSSASAAACADVTHQLSNENEHMIPVRLTQDVHSEEAVASTAASSADAVLHLTMPALLEFLGRLPPQDRFLSYVMPSTGPVHLHLLIDADLDQFVHLRKREEEQCVEELIRLLEAFFASSESGICRSMDRHGILLLEHSDPSRMRWRIHVPGEAFQDAQQHALFVARFLTFIEEQTEEAENAKEVAAGDIGEDDCDEEFQDSDDADRKAGWQFPVPLCLFDPLGFSGSESERGAQGTYHHILSSSSSAEKQLALPFTSDPVGGSIVQVRSLRWNEEDRCTVERLGRKATLVHQSLSIGGDHARLLFSALPGMALPSDAKYRLLVMSTWKSKERRCELDEEDVAPVGNVEAMSNTNVAIAAAGVKSNAQNAHARKAARHDSDRDCHSRSSSDRSCISSSWPMQEPTILLTDEEWKTVHEILAPCLLPSTFTMPHPQRDNCLVFPSCTVVAIRRRREVSLTLQVTGEFVCPALLERMNLVAPASAMHHEPANSCTQRGVHSVERYRTSIMEVELSKFCLTFQCNQCIHSPHQAWPLNAKGWKVLKGAIDELDLSEKGVGSGNDSGIRTLISDRAAFQCNSYTFPEDPSSSSKPREAITSTAHLSPEEQSELQEAIASVECDDSEISASDLLEEKEALRIAAVLKHADRLAMPSGERTDSYTMDEEEEKVGVQEEEPATDEVSEYTSSSSISSMQAGTWLRGEGGNTRST